MSPKPTIWVSYIDYILFEIELMTTFNSISVNDRVVIDCKVNGQYIDTEGNFYFASWEWHKILQINPK